MSSHPANDLPPVGTVARPGPEGQLVVESNGQPVEPGTRCQTRDGHAAGVVEDVIGSVERPFLVVDPTQDHEAEIDPQELTGSQLYPR